MFLIACKSIRFEYGKGKAFTPSAFHTSFKAKSTVRAAARTVPFLFDTPSLNESLLPSAYTAVLVFPV
jgi:hypothetical protein